MAQYGPYRVADLTGARFRDCDLSGVKIVASWLVDGLTDGELERTCTRAPAPGYPDETRTVGVCLYVVMKEECEHHRYAACDLVVLEARERS